MHVLLPTGVLCVPDDYHVEGVGLTKDEVTALLRGPAGSRVDLVVADAAGRPRHVSLDRRSLPQPPVKQVLALPCQWILLPWHGRTAAMSVLTQTAQWAHDDSSSQGILRS